MWMDRHATRLKKKNKTAFALLVTLLQLLVLDLCYTSDRISIGLLPTYCSIFRHHWHFYIVVFTSNSGLFTQGFWFLRVYVYQEDWSQNQHTGCIRLRHNQMTLLQNWRISISLIISVTVHTNFLIYKCKRTINVTNTHTCKMITFSTIFDNIIHAFNIMELKLPWT